MFCTYCGREFSRREHLQRHLLTHTKVKMFECSICNLSFARKDLVQKHFAVHSQEEIATARNISSTPSSTVTKVVPTQSRRNVIACFHCAKTKIKCDHQYPCDRCQQKNIACIPQPPRRPRTRKVSLPTPDAPDAPDAIDPAVSSPKAVPSPGGPSQDDIAGSRIHTSAVDLDPTPQAYRLTPEMDNTMTVAPESSARRQCSPTSRFGGLYDVEQDHSMQILTSNDGIDRMESVENLRELQSSVLGETCQGPPRRPYKTNETSMLLPLLGASIPSAPPLDAYNLEQALAEDMNMADTVDPFQPSNMLSDASLFALDAIPDFSKLQYLEPCDLGFLDGHVNPQNAFEAPTESTALPDPVFDIPQNPTNVTSGADAERPEDVEHWTIFQCTPLLNDPPPYMFHRYVAHLERNFRSPGPWAVSEENWRNSYFPPQERFTNVSLTDETRERMVMIAQYFLRLSLDCHGPSAHPPLNNCPAGGSLSIQTPYISLPSTKILSIYLETFLASFEPYYPLNPARGLNPNKLAPSSNEKGATLLLLLMIAYGAMKEPTAKARHLAVGIAEIARLAILDHLEKDNYASRRALTLHCGLLSTVENAFGGEKWHMEIGMGQRHAFLTMMRHAGFFRWTDPKHWLSRRETGVDNIWKAWIEKENISRLAYGWVLADQEISLFHDSQPIIRVAELEVMLPAGDNLWLAANAVDWAGCLGADAASPGRIPVLLSQKTQPSLRQLFQLLLDNKLNQLQVPMQILHMRLLLFPIQVLVHQQSQVLAILPSGTTSARAPRRALEISCALRSDDVECLLQRWKHHFDSLPCKGTRLRLMKQAALILFHLINIDLHAFITDIERFTRGETSACFNSDDITGRDQLVRSPEKVIFHCGQVLRLIWELESELRPLWWSAAVYRVAIALWACAIFALTGPLEVGTETMSRNEEYAAIDRLPEYSPTLQGYLHHRKGHPCLTARDGTQVAIRDSSKVLTVCIEVLDDGPLATKLCQGASWKLRNLLKASESASCG